MIFTGNDGDVWILKQRKKLFSLDVVFDEVSHETDTNGEKSITELLPLFGDDTSNEMDSITTS